MENTEKSKFQFTGFQIIKSIIEKKEAEKVGTNFSLGFSPRGEKEEKSNEFKLYLGVKVEDEKKTFKAEIEAVGYFKFDPSQEEKILGNFFYINAPAILFPYIRAYISALTNLSGIETVTLPTINMTSLGNTLKENTSSI